MAISRVSTQFQQSNFVQNIFNQQNALQKLRDEVASGFRVSEPADAPGPAGTIVDLQSTINRLTRHKERIGYAENQLQGQDTALNSVEDLMIRAKELASQAANEVYSVEQRSQLATEVWAIRESVVALANTQIFGKYIYGGTADTTPPMTLNPVPYTNPPGPSVPENQHWIFTTATGSTTTKTVAITDNETVAVNTPGAQIFQPAVDALERLGRALEGYRTTPEVSNATPDLGGAAFVFPADFHGQTSAIINALDQIEASSQTIIGERSSVGGRMNRLTQAAQVLTGITADAEKTRSDLQDSDTFDVASKLANLQTSFQALLATGAQINQLSLLDFL